MASMAAAGDNDSEAAEDDDECEGVAYMFDAAAATERRSLALSSPELGSRFGLDIGGSLAKLVLPSLQVAGAARRPRTLLAAGRARRAKPPPRRRA